MRTAALALLMLVGGAVFAQTAPDPTEQAIHRRAVEAINWGMPAVNLDLMLQAGIRAGAKPNQIVYWSRLTRVGLTDGHERVRTWLGDGPAAAGARIEARLFTPERHDATTDADARRRE